MPTLSRYMLLIAILALLLSRTVQAADDEADETVTAACAAPEFRQFDFWVGEWDLTWGDSGRGENIVTIELDSCVIVENFTTLGVPLFVGRSVSTYSVPKARWHQTWVDNSGGYLDFAGGVVGDSMIMSRTAVRGDSVFHQRMVWYNITPNSLDWNWERSMDDGSSWETLWNIHYVRRR